MPDTIHYKLHTIYRVIFWAPKTVRSGAVGIYEAAHTTLARPFVQKSEGALPATSKTIFFDL